MTSSFDAYDLMRRSILSSIMGLKRKQRPDNPPVNQMTPKLFGAPSSSSLLSQPSIASLERTPHDIYREIVDECQQLERSGSSSPSSDIDTGPATPTEVSATSHSPAIAPMTAITMEPFRIEQQSQQISSSFIHTDDYAALIGAPPPYSLAPIEPIVDVPPTYPINNLLTSAEPTPLIPPRIRSKKEDIQLSAYSIEEIVRIVVSALRSSALTEFEKESPEEILRRKRQQNNEAAARYRKRQREARHLAEGELELLLRRNESLRQTVEQMQNEIAELRKAVLKGHPS